MTNASPTQDLRSATLYHGTNSRRGYNGIVSRGLQANHDAGEKYKGAENFAPLPGAYLTKDIGVATRYSFMRPPDPEQEPYGYVFEFHGKDLQRVTPDEDELGGYLSYLVKLVKQKQLPPKLQGIVDAVPADLRAKLLEPESDLDFETVAMAGKWLLQSEKLSEPVVQYLMKSRSNVVNYGDIHPVAVWVIPKPTDQFLKDRQGTYNTHNGYVNYAKRYGRRTTL